MKKKMVACQLKCFPHHMQDKQLSQGLCYRCDEAFFSLTANHRHCKVFISFVTGQWFWQHASCVGTDFMTQYLQCLSFLKLFWLFCHKCKCYTLIRYSPKQCSKFLHFCKKNVNTCLAISCLQAIKESVVKTVCSGCFICVTLVFCSSLSCS